MEPDHRQLTLTVMSGAEQRSLPVAGQVGLSEELSEQHAIRHVLQHRSLCCVVLKTNTVPHLWQYRLKQKNKTQRFRHFNKNKN